MAILQYNDANSVQTVRMLPYSGTFSLGLFSLRKTPKHKQIVGYYDDMLRAYNDNENLTQRKFPAIRYLTIPLYCTCHHYSII